MSSVLEQRALKWIPLALVAAVTLAGCARDEGFYDDRNLDYVDAEPASPLVLPDTRNTQRYRDALPVPEVASERSQDEAAEVRPPQPLTVGSRMKPDYVESRESGDQRWLVVAADPGSVWTQLERFARARGLGIQESRAEEGILRTSQAEFRLTSALRGGSSEVRCERGGQSMASCLDDLEAYLSNSSSSQPASAAASSWSEQRQEDETSISLRQQGDEWQLLVPSEADRVWAEIHHYLEQDFNQEGERDLLNADPETNEFLVEYMTERERQRNPLQIVFSSDVRRMSQEIRLLVATQGDETVVKAVNASDRQLTPDDQRELLERVSGYLR